MPKISDVNRFDRENNEGDPYELWRKYSIQQGNPFSFVHEIEEIKTLLVTIKGELISLSQAIEAIYGELDGSEEE